jgi:succinate dehydrogenase / fumarate reductase, cytochrome b subunit
MTTPVKERTFESDEKLKLPRPFILRRLHSLLGLWLVVYLSGHLLVNSQAALFFKDDGYGFVSAVNKLESLPYLRIIEVIILALPFLIHGIWGIFYAYLGKLNAHRTDGRKPALAQYKRNRAYSWQRITSWLLVVGIVAHVAHMRFIAYPAHAIHGDQQSYMVRIAYDPGLPLVAEKLHVKLYDNTQILQKKESLKRDEAELAKLEKKQANVSEFQQDDTYFLLLDHVLSEKGWLQGAEKKPLKKGEVLGVAPNAGGAFFLLVRETFKSPLMVILYSILVIAAAYHAFNGLWTLMITWGITLTRRSQKRMHMITTTLMGVVMFLGLMAAWGTYWTIQFQG